jgi:hypothetical protein
LFNDADGSGFQTNRKFKYFCMVLTYLAMTKT